MGWRMILSMILPMIEAAGQAKVNEDDNETGKDDLIGQGILAGIRIFRAVLKSDTTTLEKLVPPDIRVRTLTAQHFVSEIDTDDEAD